jgi:hypothetical protein
VATGATVFLDQGQTDKGAALYVGEVGGPMRFFFNIRDKLEIEDGVGREFALTSDAVVFAKHLAADIRCLETTVRPALAIEVVAENDGQVHREVVFD